MRFYVRQPFGGEAMSLRVWVPVLLVLGFGSSLAAETLSQPLLTWTGDLRNRFESLRNEAAGTGKNESYDQLRLRARLGAKIQPAETVTAELRLATGTGGNSTNQSYGDTVKGSRNYDFKLDRAAFLYTPAPLLPGFTAQAAAGRMANPFVLVGENDLLLDSDLNFDGGAVTGKYETESWSAGAIISHVVLDEAKDVATAQDVTLTVLEAFARLHLGSEASLGLTAAQYAYRGLPQHAVIVTDFAGNSNNGSVYTYGYRVTSFGLEAKVETGLAPLTVFVEQAKNEEVSSEDTALIYGFRLGRLKNPGDWLASIDWREVRRDSTLGIFADGDSFGGGTDGRSLRLTAGYAIDGTFAAGASYFTGERAIASTAVKRERLMLDLNLKF